LLAALHDSLNPPYLCDALTSRAVIKLAETLLDRFFREAEGTNQHKIDLEYVFHDEGTTSDKAEESIQYLESRGLIKMEGFDAAFMTDFGVQTITNETKIGDLPKKEVLWGDGDAVITTKKPIEPIEPVKPIEPL